MKFFEKYDLLKLAGIFVIVAALLTWVCNLNITSKVCYFSYYSGGEIQAIDGASVSKVGIFDMGNALPFIAYYNFSHIIFVLVVAGFYKFLGSLKAYKVMTEKIAKSIPPLVFAGISTVFFALLSGVSTNYFALFALIPLFISIMSKMKFDKVSAIASTVGGILVGIIGGTYSAGIVGQLVSEIGVGVKYGYELINIIILFVICTLLLTFFTIERMRKAEKKNYELLEDPFASEIEISEKEKVNIIPLAVIIVLTILSVIAGFIGWQSVFNLNFFADIKTSILEATLFNVPIFANILGSSFTEFGSWTLYTISILLFIVSIIIKIIYSVSLDEMLDSFAKGFKKAGYPILVLVVVLTVGVISMDLPVLPSVINNLLGLATNFATLFVGGILTSVFTVDFNYTVSLVGQAYANYANNSVAALSLQSAFGIVGLIAPTSAILMLTLATFNVKFKDWVKHIWMVVLPITIVSIIMMVILTIF